MKSLLIVVFVAALSSTQADVNYFCVPPGTPGVPENPDYLSWETAGTNIHEAVRIANNPSRGDKWVLHRLYVKSGFYLINKEIEIAGSRFEMVSSKGADAQDEIDPEGTLLCGGYPDSTNRIVRIFNDSFDNNRHVVFRGFTVTNGWTEGNGGGICFEYGRWNPNVISDCRIVGNFAYKGSGGGIYASPFAPRLCITNCVVSGNTVSNDFSKGSAPVYGGGVCLMHISGAIKDNAKNNDGYGIFNCEIFGNRACGDAANVSGVYAGKSPLWMENTSVSNNIATALSGGTSSDGAGVYVYYGAKIINCNVSRNLALDCGGASGIHASSGCEISNCVFLNNSGAPVILAEAYSSDMNNAPVTLADSILDGNGDSGHALVNASKGAVMRNCLLMNAKGFLQATQSAALRISESGNVIENCTIANSTKGVWCDNRYASAMVNCAFYGNELRDLHQSNMGGVEGMSFINCYFDSTTPRYGEDIVSRPCTDCVVSASPRFTDPENGDFTLQRKSPLRDAGMSLSWMTGSKDLAGNARLCNAQGLPSSDALPDIGCFECALRNRQLCVIVR